MGSVLEIPGALGFPEFSSIWRWCLGWPSKGEYFFEGEYFWCAIQCWCILMCVGIYFSCLFLLSCVSDILIRVFPNVELKNYVWCLSSLYVKSKVVLAKNLPKGGIVGYLNVGSTFAKTRCWMWCSNIWVWFKCTMLLVLQAIRASAILGNPRGFTCWLRHVMLLVHQGACL